MNITAIKPGQYDRLVALWEASVRASHFFLAEADIQRLRPLVRDRYLDAVRLKGARDGDGQIIGFLGTRDGMVEMLFVDPAHIGKGVGRALMEHAMTHENAVGVDVNEQNPAAVAFYKHLCFEVTGRSELDGQGQPFPVLHMTLKGVSGPGKVADK